MAKGLLLHSGYPGPFGLLTSPLSGPHSLHFGATTSTPFALNPNLCKTWKHPGLRRAARPPASVQSAVAKGRRCRAGASCSASPAPQRGFRWPVGAADPCERCCSFLRPLAGGGRSCRSGAGWGHARAGGRHAWLGVAAGTWSGWNRTDARTAPSLRVSGDGCLSRSPFP